MEETFSFKLTRAETEILLNALYNSRQEAEKWSAEVAKELRVITVKIKESSK